MKNLTPQSVTAKSFWKKAKSDIRAQNLEFSKVAFNVAVFKTRRMMFQKYGNLDFAMELNKSGTANFIAFYKQTLAITAA